MPEITFSSVKDAVRWSEEVALMPPIQSSMKLLYSTGGGNLNQNEAVDIAQTVTHITASTTHPITGMAIKAIMSRPTRDIDRTIGIFIASRLIGTDEGVKKSIDQLINLGMVTVIAMREKELYGNKYPIRKCIDRVGISRDRFTRGKCWIILRAAAKDQLNEWIEQATLEIFGELSNRGWMS